MVERLCRSLNQKDTISVKDPKAIPAGAALIGKAIDILEAISHNGGAADHALLSKSCNLSRPTLYRILQALSARGLVRPADSQFMLGYGFLDMATQVWASSDLTTVAAGELKRLRDITGETAYLAVMEGAGVLSIGRFQGAHSKRSSAALGSVKPLHCTSQGKAFLAHLPQAQRDRLLEGSLVALTERTITDPILLDVELAKTRARGYALDDEEIVMGTRCVGAPVLDDSGLPIAAVSVAGPSFRITLARTEYLGQEVKEAAHHIAARLTPRKVGQVSALDYLPVTEQPGFHGLDPHWNAKSGVLSWADRYASALLQRDPSGLVTEAATFSKRIEAFAMTKAVGPAVFHEDEVVFPELGRRTPFIGFKVLAGCADQADNLWVSTSENRLGRLRADGSLIDTIDLPCAATSLAAMQDRSVFVVSAEGGSLHRFDPTTRRLRLFANISRAAGLPSGVADAGDGGYWLALTGGWSVLRLNDVGEISQSSALPIADATGLCVGEDGRALFVTSARHRLRREELIHAPLSGHVFRLPVGTG